MFGIFTKILKILGYRPTRNLRIDFLFRIRVYVFTRVREKCIYKSEKEEKLFLL
jgi:hypothetical protein